jgi:Family of unknown function (DUF6166)
MWIIYVIERDPEREGFEMHGSLNPRVDLVNHSPSGFSWGYGGSGPCQTALAVLAHAVGDERALRLYQKFKEDRIAPLDTHRDWEMTCADIQQWATEQEKLAD